MPTTVYVWSKVALDDPESYYFGWKGVRVIDYSNISRALSGDDGQYETASFGFTLSDYDGFLRNLLGGANTKYGFLNRQVALRMISNADRLLLKTPRLIARGVIRDFGPQPDLTFRVECEDFAASKLSTQNLKKQIPQRTIQRGDFPNCPIAAINLGVPIIYGQVSDEGSASSPPVLSGDPARGYRTEGGYYQTGYGDRTSTAAVPTGVVLNTTAGGTVSANVPDSKYGVIVTAVDAAGAESNPEAFYTNEMIGASRGTFQAGVATIVVDGTQNIVVTWNAAANAAKYRVYLASYYYGAQWHQMIEVTAPTVTATFTTNPDFGVTETSANITPGAVNIQWKFRYEYAVQALMVDGYTTISSVTEGRSEPYRRPVRVQWLAVAGALGYRVVRRVPLQNWAQYWDVSGASTFFDDDMLDTGTVFLTNGLTVPTGSVPTIHVGTRTGISGTDADRWQAFLICGHAIKEIISVYKGGVRIPNDHYGITWAVPGKAGFGTYFADPGAVQYYDINGNRYTLLYVRGPDGESAVNDTTQAITVNVKGIESVGDSSGTLITDIIQQYKHFVINFGFQDYRAGAWLTAPFWSPLDSGLSQVDEVSFDTATALGAGYVVGGYVGGGVIGNRGEQLTLREWMARFANSGNVRHAFSRKQQFFVTMFDTGTDLATARRFTQVNDIIAGGFYIRPNVSKLFTEQRYNYAYQWSKGEWASPDQPLVNGTAETKYKEKQVAPTVDLYFVYAPTVASNIMQHRLNRSSTIPNMGELKTHMGGTSVELGDIILVTHVEGIGTGGYVDHPVRVFRHEVDPDDFLVTLEIEDVAHLLV